MPSLKFIRKRISSVKNTQKITKAMKMVSAAKLRRAQEKAESSRPYEAELLKVVASMLAETEVKSALTESREVKCTALVVISSDRGLCGSLNSHLFKKVNEYISQDPTKNYELITLGRKSRDFFVKRGRKPAESHLDVMRLSSFESLSEIAKSLQERFLSGSVDQVEVFYNEFRSALIQKPTAMTLLPVGGLNPEMAEDLNTSFIVEPQADEMLEKVLPMLVEFRFYRMVIESIASEHAARMTAMDSATNNARDMISKLTLQMNRARQAAITKELMEIIGGAEAISA